MAKNKGWIKIHRSIMENWIYDDPHTFKAFIHLCMIVNINEEKAMVDGNFINVQAGQRITSVTTLSKELKFSWRTVDKILNDLEADDMIKRQPIGRGFILTVTNYKKYQRLLESSGASSLPSSFKGNPSSSLPSRQIKKGKEYIKTGKEKTVKNPPKRGGWLGKGEPPK